MNATGTAGEYRCDDRQRGLGLVAAGTAAVVTVVAFGPIPSASAEAARTLPTNGSREHVHRRISIWGGDGKVDTSILVEGDITLRRTAEPGVWERVWSQFRPIIGWGPGKAEAMKEAAEDDEPASDRSDLSSNFWDLGTTEVSPESIASTPRDTAALLTDLTDVKDPDSALQKSTERAIDRAGDLLGSGLADAGLQAAIYRALERLPGLLVDRHATDVDGCEGVGIGVITSSGQQRIDLVIDSATGRFLGRTETDLFASAGAPAGTIEESTAFYPR